MQSGVVSTHTDHGNHPVVNNGDTPDFDRVALNAYNKQSTRTLINMYHRTCLNAPISSWIKAIRKGFFASWPKLTAANVRMFCTKKAATCKGHMKQRPSNIRTTDATKTERRRLRRTLSLSLVDSSELKHVMGMDYTGRYPTTLRRGHKYVFVMFDHNTNYIAAVPVKSRKKDAYIAAFQQAIDVIGGATNASIVRHNNEVSRNLEEAITEHGLNYQFVLAYTHRANPAEKAFSTFKAYFKSACAGCNHPSLTTVIGIYYYRRSALY